MDKLWHIAYAHWYIPRFLLREDGVSSSHTTQKGSSRELRSVQRSQVQPYPSMCVCGFSIFGICTACTKCFLNTQRISGHNTQSRQEHSNAQEKKRVFASNNTKYTKRTPLVDQQSLRKHLGRREQAEGASTANTASARLDWRRCTFCRPTRPHSLIHEK